MWRNFTTTGNHRLIKENLDASIAIYLKSSASFKFGITIKAGGTYLGEGGLFQILVEGCGLRGSLFNRVLLQGTTV